MSNELVKILKEMSSPRIGDIAVIAVLLIAIGTQITTHTSNGPLYLIVRKSGKITHKYLLPLRQKIKLNGAIGFTEVEISNYRVRVTKDPGPKQICVRQGWIEKNNSVLICAPSEITLEIKGDKHQYDSTSY